MSNVKAIYQRDLRALFSSPFVIITFLALCILPSLYTLINVRAIWNPYDTSEIKNIPVAVVNKDQGATLAGQKLNVGQTVVKTLKNDHQLNWKFASAKTATTKLRSGQYYAEIVIPKNFSKSLSSIAGSHAHKAKLVYRANSRDSPMGGKITETAAKTLVNQVQTTFLETVNTTIFSKLNILGNKAQSQSAEILELKDWIITMSNSMSLATGALSEISQTSTNMASILTGLKPVMTASQNVDVLQTTNTETISSLRSVQKTINKAFTSLNTNLSSANAGASRLNHTLNQLNSEVSSGSRSTVSTTLNRAISQVDLLKGQITPLQSFLKSVNGQAKLQGLTGLNNTLGNAVSLLNATKTQLKSLKSTLNTTGKLTSGDIQLLTHEHAADLKQPKFRADTVQHLSEGPFRQYQHAFDLCSD
ncbi:hypothetical protein AYR62_13525 [Secundilactobacillus paracollinoides]|uniref:YhgE/Pip family protein n=2 Tax=Secundilactobacillus paracollinoides TaxID=240427 RepID=UPI00081AADCE|nr:YhgE/Pip family protein [Secundilactobacillus paracollinoides]ANZ64997.1 hypothetical protein AYR62_13525 [Secundilactobacillus paracollinoides]